MCPAYLCGFCVDGPICKYTHPSFDIPSAEQMQAARRPFGSTMNVQQITCHNCHEKGHKASSCPQLPPGTVFNAPVHVQRHPLLREANPLEKRPIQDVTCYKVHSHYMKISVVVVSIEFLPFETRFVVTLVRRQGPLREQMQ